MSGTGDDVRAEASSRMSTPSLPSFRPIRDDSGPSTRGSSSASRGEGRSQGSLRDDPFDRREQSSFGSTPESRYLDHPDGQPSVRAKQRSSGGFLLENAYPTNKLSRSLLSRSHKSGKDIKGKRRSDEPELFVAKRRPRDVREAHRSSIGSSPLATEIQRDNEDGKKYGDIGTPTKATPSQQSVSSRASEGLMDPSDHRGAGQTQPQKIGLGADSAQIVSMALSLSEARRRQASGMRVISSIMPGQRGPSGQLAPSGSIRQYLNHQRQVSRNVSPRPQNQSPKINGGQKASGVYTGPDVFMDDEDAEQTSYTLSQATVKRVQKAKNFFELAYEHRRLLSHLPPLRSPGGQSKKADTEGQSKIYNPLQYVRNRKLRFRERNPIPAEQEGWHDIFQVRAWVDAVVAAHGETRHDTDECIRLPDLSYRQPAEPEDDNDSMDLDLQDDRQINDKNEIKPYRPRKDWEFHPGDMIADAHWLEQGLNKTRIEDGEGNPIYPPDTQFKRSGWRNRTPVHLPPGLQGPMPTPEASTERDVEHDLAQPTGPELPTFRSAHHDKKLRKERGRRRDKIRHSISSLPKDDSGSRKRLAKPFQLDDSSTSSSASDFDHGEYRGRKHSKKARSGSSPSKDRFGFHRKHTDETETGSIGPLQSANGHSQTQSGPSSKHGSIDSSRIHRLFTRESAKGTTPLRQSKSRSESTRRGSYRPRISQDSEREPRSSAEYDTTAPSSPSASEFPSIAINLSPPQSRSPSPTKKSLPSRLNPFRDRSKNREGINVGDFAFPLSAQSSHQTSADIEGADNSSGPGSRDPSPMTRGTSPLTPGPRSAAVNSEHERHADDHRSSTVSRVSTNSTTERSTKIRGMFKGGRIAELVGNEVNRAGAFIWKRDPPGAHKPRMSTSTASLHSHHDSDTDEESHINGHVMSTPPSQHHNRYPSYASTQSDRDSQTAMKTSPSSGEKPQYHNPNLPTFTSPFQRDQEVQQEKKRALLNPIDSGDGDDHISRAAAEHRSTSKSPRLNRLAPPKLDTSRPSTPPGFEHRDSYGFGSQLDLSRSRDASHIYNGAMSAPEGMPTTGLAGLKASRSGVSLSRNWNASHQSLVPEKEVVTHQNIARAYALLISTAVKAREIGLRANAVREPIPKFLADTLDAANESQQSSTPLRVRRKDEHVVAARNLIVKLSSQADVFQGNIRDFTGKTTPALHEQLQRLEDAVENTLTPRVHGAADQAGELSMKLNTTSTLAVKGVNDQIGSALRMRRRGPVRWLRRLGYKLIEMGVVGLLWGIWLVVTLIRAFLGLFTGTYRTARWLLWLN